MPLSYKRLTLYIHSNIQNINKLKKLILIYLLDKGLSLQSDDDLPNGLAKI